MKKATELLKRFIRKIGGINELADFDMELLKEEEYREFGCRTKRFEYDNSELVKALFVVLWHDRIDNLDFDSIGDGGDRKRFRGDTIHTSGALFGKKNEKTGKYEGLHDRYGIQDEVLQSAIDHWPVSRIGNMLLLPSKSIEQTNAKGITSHVTINTFRGFQSGWHDYFDIFLDNIQKVGIPPKKIEYGDSQDSLLARIMSLPENMFYYFKFFKSFEDWCDSMMLTGYLENGHVKKCFVDLDFKQYPYHWRYRNIESHKDDYKDWVLAFIKWSKKLINDRSQSMVDELINKGF